MVDKLDDIHHELAVFFQMKIEQWRKLNTHQQAMYFEKFVAWQVIRHKHYGQFETRNIADVSTGGSLDDQIDTLMVLVDGEPVYTPDEARQVKENKGINSISYVFIQTTMGRVFDRQKMQASISGVKGFFSTAHFDINENLQQKRKMREHLNGGGEDTEQPHIQTYFYYVSLSAGMDESKAEQRRKAQQFRAWAMDELHDRLPEGADPFIELLNVKKLRGIIRDNNGLVPQPEIVDEGQKPVIREIAAPNLIPLPPAPQIDGGFIGYLRASDYLELLESEDGSGLIDELSTHNLRRFLGAHNPVNLEISDTLKSESSHQFLFRNNGITIVTPSAKLNEGKLRLENYQIVNGLQTSHILYNNRSRVKKADDIYVPVKIIITLNEKLRSAIARSSNRQTDIVDIQSESSSPFVLKLWDCFNKNRENHQQSHLWLERHKGEYDNIIPAKKSLQLIELDELVRVIGATVLHQPHVAAANPARLRSLVPDQIFNDGHHLPPYLVAAHILFRVRQFMTTRQGRKIQPRFRFHLAAGLYEFLLEKDAPINMAHEDWPAICDQINLRLVKARKVGKALSYIARSLEDQAKKIDLESVKGRKAHGYARAFKDPFMRSVRDKASSFRW